MEGIFAHIYPSGKTPLHCEIIMKIIGINASPKGEKSQTRRLVMAGT